MKPKRLSRGDVVELSDSRRSSHPTTWLILKRYHAVNPGGYDALCLDDGYVDVIFPFFPPGTWTLLHESNAR